MALAMLPKSYPGVPAGTPIITDLNQAPNRSYLYTIASGHAMHHDPESGETQYYDHQGQPTDQLNFLDAHSKATSYGDPNAYASSNLASINSAPPSSLPDHIAQSTETMAYLSKSLGSINPSTPEGAHALSAMQQQMHDEAAKQEYLMRMRELREQASKSAGRFIQGQ